MKIYSALNTPALTGQTQTPIKDLTGKITGYSTTGTGFQDKPLYGSQPVKTSRAKPQQNSNGQFIDTSTGLPYHGGYMDESGRTQYFSNGKQVGSAADVGIQNQTFSVQRTPKNPTITSNIDQLQSDAANSSGMMSKSFGDYLKESSRVNADAKTQLAKDQSAYDTTGTENRLNNDVASQSDALLANNRNYETGQNKVLDDVGAATRSYTGSLNSSLGNYEQNNALTSDQLRQNNADYSASQRGVQGEVVDQNKNYSTTVADRLNKLKSDLDTQNAQYESASQAVADRAYGAAKKQTDLYQLTSGTPTSGSGNLDNRYIRAYQDINIPLQQQLAERRYQQVNQLDAAHAGADAQNYQNLMQQYAGESSLNADLSNRGITLAQYLQGLGSSNYGAETAAAGAGYNANLNLDQARSGMNTDFANRNADTTKYLATTDAQTAQQIQSLRTATAGMSRSAAAQYLQQLAVPAQMAQQILGNDIANQSSLQSLDERANAYTFNTPYDSSRVPSSPGFSAVAPRSYSPTSSPNVTGTRSYDTGLPNGGVDNGQVGSVGANGWVLGSDGNYYVPDATQKTGYRMVWRHPSTNTGPYPASRSYTSGQGYTGSDGAYSVNPNYDFAQPNPFIPNDQNFVPEKNALAAMQAQYQ